MKKIISLIFSLIFISSSYALTQEQFIDIANLIPGAKFPYQSCYYICTYHPEWGGNSHASECTELNDAVNKLYSNTKNYIGQCGNGNSNNRKVTICHKTGSSSNPYVNISVDIHAVDAHLAHGDTIGECTDNPGEEKITVTLCNAGLTQNQTSEISSVVGDSTTLHSNDSNNYITALVNDEYLSIVGGTDGSYYEQLSEDALNTEINAGDSDSDILSFILNTGVYGAKYFVEWCIVSSENTSFKIESSFATSDNQYVDHAEIYTKQEIYCGKNENLSQKFSTSPVPMSSTLSTSASISGENKNCILRQYFYETSSGVRPNSGSQIEVTGLIKVNE